MAYLLTAGGFLRCSNAVVQQFLCNLSCRSILQLEFSCIFLLKALPHVGQIQAESSIQDILLSCNSVINWTQKNLKIHPKII